MKKLLAIDDKDDNLVSLKAIIRNYMPDIEIFLAKDGKHGLEIAETELPDAIVLDIIMPEMDGYHVCKLLKRNPQTKHIPIIMLTAIRTDTDSKVKGLESGADAFITKPIEPNELTAQIKVMLRIKEAEDKLRAERELLDEIVKQRTAELSESRKKLKLFMESATDLFTLWSADLKLIEINRLDSYFTKDVAAKEDVIGASLKHIYPNLDKLGNVEKYLTMAKIDDLIEIEDHVKDKANSELWFKHKIFKAGNGIGIITSDITKQKIAEEALRKSERKIRNIFDNSPIGIFQSTRTGRCLATNKKFAEMLGFTSSEILRNDFNILSRIAENDDKNEFVKTLTEKNELLNYQIKLKQKSNDVKWVAIYIKTIQDRVEGELYYDGFAIDITQRKIAEEISRIQEQQLIAIFEGLGEEVVYVSDPETYEMLYMSNNALEVWGDYVGKKCYEVLQNYDSPCHFCTNHHIFGDNIGKTHVWEFKNNINNRWYRCVDRAIRWPNGKMVRFELGIDITERKQTEEELKNRNEFINTILENLHIGVAVNTIDNGETVFINPAFAKIYGWPMDKLRTVEDFWKNVYPDKEYGQKLKAKVMADIESGDPSRMHWEGPIATAQDGSKRILDCYNIPIFSQNLMISTAIDITERKNSENALRENEKILRNIFENSTNLFFSHTTDNKIVYLSPQVEEMLGYSIDEAKEYWNEIKTDNPINKKGALKTIDAILSGKAQDPFELELKHKCGKHVWVEVREVPMIEDGETNSIIGSLTDITKRKIAEKELQKAQEQLHQSQKMEAYGQLAGGIAHDFNNILGTILGYSELIENSISKDGKTYSKIQNIKSAAKRAADLTRQLLAFSRKQTLQPQVINLNIIITDLKKMLLRMIEANIELVTEFDPNIEKILADPGQMGQIFMNLVVNARDAMPKGGTLKIKTRNKFVDQAEAITIRDMPVGEYVLVEISDTGLGIDNEVIEHIFEPFFTTKEIDQGTGLGLSVVHGIVKQSNGYITVRSERNQGTTFSIYFPAVIKDYESNRITKIHRNDKTLSGSESILIVEDNEELRSLISEILTTHNYNVISAESSSDVLNIVGDRKNNINLIITDIIMPELDGIELAEKVLQENPEMKIIYISGYADGYLNKMNISKEVSPLLEKPFTITSLLEIVRETLDKPQE